MKNFGFSLFIALLSFSSSVKAVSWHSMGRGLDARYGHTFIYDGNSQTSLLFGGVGYDESQLGNLWEWNGSSWYKKIDCGSSVCPSRRALHAMTFCRQGESGVSVLFGGYTWGLDYNSTWILNSAGWYELAAQLESPQRRFGHAMAFDEVTGKLVLFGGEGDKGLLPETREFDVNTGLWTKYEVPGPMPRKFHSMVFDPNRQKVMLFGGEDAAHNLFSDVWAWEGQLKTWSRFREKEPSPSSRSGQSAVYYWNSGLGRLFHDGIFLFGGLVDFGNAYQSGESWFWVEQKKRWLAKRPDFDPQARELFGLSYDESRNTIVLYGGLTRVAGEMSDLWEFR